MSGGEVRREERIDEATTEGREGVQVVAAVRKVEEVGADVRLDWLVRGSVWQRVAVTCVVLERETTSQRRASGPIAGGQWGWPSVLLTVSGREVGWSWLEWAGVG
jgi:hypothetical protein